MFYCDACAKKLGWPDLFYISRGNCEVCSKYASCYERKSSTLPMQTPSPYDMNGLPELPGE